MYERMKALCNDPDRAPCAHATWRTWVEAASIKEWLTQTETTVAAQMQEMELVRQKVYELERNQIQIKQR
jgi:hypothetical protein